MHLELGTCYLQSKPTHVYSEVLLSSVELRQGSVYRIAALFILLVGYNFFYSELYSFLVYELLFHDKLEITKFLWLNTAFCKDDKRYILMLKRKSYDFARTYSSSRVASVFLTCSRIDFACCWRDCLLFTPSCIEKDFLTRFSASTAMATVCLESSCKEVYSYKKKEFEQYFQ